MVYLKSVRCDKCGVLMHNICSSSNHFCLQVQNLNKGRPSLTGSVTDATNHPLTSHMAADPSALEWQFMSLQYETYRQQTISCTSNQSLDLNMNSFTFAQVAALEPEPEVFDDQQETDDSDTPQSSHPPRSPIEQWSQNLTANIRQLKNWWQSRKRRNSRELVNKANSEDKHVRSRYSLSTDEKQARKQLEQLVKTDSKKSNKVRFDCPTGAHVYPNRSMSISPDQLSSNVPKHSHYSNAFAFKSLVKTTAIAAQSASAIPSTSSACINNTMNVSTPFKQKLCQIKQRLLEETDEINKPMAGNDSTNNELIASGQHVYCGSRLGIRRRTIPKLFQAQQSQINAYLLQVEQGSDKFDTSVEQDKHLALTKARTLSMEAKSSAYDSFLATWPTSSTVIGSENDFLPTEAELNSHLAIDCIADDVDVGEIIKEWRIPSASLSVKEKIGETRIGSIYKGQWHGDVLIYKYTRSSDGRGKHPNLADFTKNLAQLSKVRHENIMLFMGACIEPENMAVITSMQKGYSLYDTLYVKQKYLPISSRLHILRQVAQAMGYLHARGIVHGKISSKNIILENKVKICLMDQGVTNHMPQSPHHLLLLRNHLTYLSPELIRSLSVHSPPNYHFTCSFTKESDSYAFGTLLYELISNRYPFAERSWEQITWQIGNGRHETIEGIKCEPFLKSLLSSCWSQTITARPAFPAIVKRLQENVSLHKRHSSSEPERLNKIGLSKNI